MSSSLSALYFSRGRGRGHAYADIAIAAEMKLQYPGLSVTFVSYSTGAETFKAENCAVIDLGLPERNPYLRTLDLAEELIRRISPDIVVSHEEFSALPAAHLCGIPAIFLSTWLPQSGGIFAESLAYCCSSIIMGEAGVFPIPAEMETRLIFVDPFVRTMKHTLADRPGLRSELGIRTNEFVASVIPGGWASEEVAPIADVVLGGYKNMPEPRRLFWLSPRDFPTLKEKIESVPGVEIHHFYPCVEKVMVVSDVIITKGTYGITMEAASLGVPSISLSPALNRIDEILVPRIRNNLALDARAVSGDLLAVHMRKILARSALERSPALNYHQIGGAKVAKILLDEIHTHLGKKQIIHRLAKTDRRFPGESQAKHQSYANAVFEPTLTSGDFDVAGKQSFH